MVRMFELLHIGTVEWTWNEGHKDAELNHFVEFGHYLIYCSQLSDNAQQ